MQVVEPESDDPSSDYLNLLHAKCMVNQLDKEVRREYAKFATDLLSLFERKGVSVNNAIFAFAHLNEESDITSDMREAADIQAFLLALRRTQSWYNFDTTAYLAESLGGAEGEKLVEAYKGKLKVHVIKRRKAFKIQTREFMVKLDYEREQFTAGKRVELRNTIASLMNLSYKHIVPKSIKNGCVELTYLFSSIHDVSKIESAIGEYSNELKKERVVLVSIDG